MAKKVSIYSTPTCHFCHLAKEFFNENDIKFEEYNVVSDLAKRQEMVDISGQMGVPVIQVDDQIVVGFDEPYLADLLELKK